MSEPQRQVELLKMYDALELMRIRIRGDEDKKELPIQILKTFLVAATQPGITMPDAAKFMGVPQSTVSRNIKCLGTYGEYDADGNPIPEKKGKGLMFSAPNEYNRRQHSMFLTAPGHRLAKELIKILE